MPNPHLNDGHEPWTEEEDLVLLGMYTEDENGFTAADVAVALKALGHIRSAQAIRARAYKLRKRYAVTFAIRPVTDIERLANHLPWR